MALHTQADLSGHTTYIAVVLSLSNVFTCMQASFLIVWHGHVYTVNQIPETVHVCKQIPYLALKGSQMDWGMPRSTKQ